MTRYFKSTCFLIAGLCWIALAVVICLFLYAYLVGGAGLQVFGFFLPVSSTTVLLGLVHFVGFSAAAFLSFVIGVGLCAHGVVPAPEREKTGTEPRERFTFLRCLGVSTRPPEQAGAALRCVRCRVALVTPVHIAQTAAGRSHDDINPERLNCNAPMRTFLKYAVALLATYLLSWTASYVCIVSSGDGLDFSHYVEYFVLAWTFNSFEIPTFIWLFSIVAYVPLAVIIVITLLLLGRRKAHAA